jgi:hypothetical protein
MTELSKVADLTIFPFSRYCDNGLSGCSGLIKFNGKRGFILSIISRSLHGNLGTMGTNGTNGLGEKNNSEYGSLNQSQTMNACRDD